MIKKSIATLLSLFLAVFAMAQSTPIQEAAEAGGLRADQKIYVVVTVLLTILSGIFLYMIRLDRKITKLENQESK